jgi:dihydrolipoamide dehydrogenase
MPKLVVVGGGPAGYGAALEAARNGIEVTLIEQSPLLGGTCLRVGCIPTKTLLETSRLYQFMKQGAEEHGLATQGVELNLQKMYQRKNQVMKKLAKAWPAW